MKKWLILTLLLSGCSSNLVSFRSTNNADLVCDPFKCCYPKQQNVMLCAEVVAPDKTYVFYVNIVQK
jgi:hypothetical protein